VGHGRALPAVVSRLRPAGGRTGSPQRCCRRCHRGSVPFRRLRSAVPAAKCWRRTRVPRSTHRSRIRGPWPTRVSLTRLSELSSVFRIHRCARSLRCGRNGAGGHRRADPTASSARPGTRTIAIKLARTPNFPVTAVLSDRHASRSRRVLLEITINIRSPECESGTSADNPRAVLPPADLGR